MTNGANIKTTDYLDGFQYNENFLEFFPHPEGYVKATPTSLNQNNPEYSFNYVFNYTDHLGNVRVSYTKDPQTGNLKILDESHYYPFGLKHQEYSTFGFVSNPIQGVVIAPLINNPYKYKYNGKEWQDELSLNMYDMDMRQYDPAIARWVVMDPVIHHSMSPYSAFDNNPVFWADPSGADSEFFSAFPDQNIDHYGTSNTIDIANIMEANQKMENTMQRIKALIKHAKDYGGKNSESGGKLDKEISKNENSTSENKNSCEKCPTFIALAKMRGGNTDLKANSIDAIPLSEWVELYKNKSFHDIINEEPKNMGMPGGPTERYVTNPYDGNIMDMRHVMIVGFMYGQTVGASIERIQSFSAKTRESSFNAQDYYSNYLGAEYHSYRLGTIGFGRERLRSNFAQGFSNWLYWTNKKNR